MRKKTLAAIVTLTVIMTMFVFCAMWITRPESSSYSLQILEEARERQKKSLITVTAPLNTDTYQMSQEERIAQKVAELLSSDNLFIKDVKDVLIADVESTMSSLGAEAEANAIKATAAYSENIVSQAIEKAALYSDQAAANAADIAGAYTREMISSSETVLAEKMDEKVALSFETDVKDYVAEELKAYSASDRAYTDSQTARMITSAADRLSKDSSFVKSIADKVISRLGISEGSEYILEVDRLVEEVLLAAFDDPELGKIIQNSVFEFYTSNRNAIFAEHQEELVSLIKSMSEDEIYSLLGIHPETTVVYAEIPAVKTEAVSSESINEVKEEPSVIKKEAAVEEKKVVSAPAVDIQKKDDIQDAEVKEKVSVPVFDTPKTGITDEELADERSSQREVEINRILQWLGE